MIKVEEVGAGSLERVNKVLGRVPQGAFKATYAALKRAGQRAKTKAGQFAAAEYTISKGTFMANVNSKTRVSGGGGGVASLSLSFAGSVLPLLEFRTRYGKNGLVSTQVKRNGGAATLEHAFVKAIFGPVAVYERLGSKRFPVEQKFGPSTGHMMQNDEVIEQMDEVIAETYNERIEHEILRLLNGW